MKTFTFVSALLLAACCIYQTRGDSLLGPELFGKNDTDAIKPKRNKVVIPDMTDKVKFDGKIDSIQYNGHYKTTVSLLVLRQLSGDQFTVAFKWDLVLDKKKELGEHTISGLNIPVNQGDVIGIYSEKRAFYYKNDAPCWFPAVSYRVRKPPSTINIGTELTFTQIKPTKQRCRRYPIIINYTPREETTPEPTTPEPTEDPYTWVGNDPISRPYVMNYPNAYYFYVMPYPRLAFTGPGKIIQWEFVTGRAFGIDIGIVAIWRPRTDMGAAYYEYVAGFQFNKSLVGRLYRITTTPIDIQAGDNIALNYDLFSVVPFNYSTTCEFGTPHYVTHYNQRVGSSKVWSWNISQWCFIPSFRTQVLYS